METAAAPITTLAKASDLATHFMECGSLGANLTLAPGERLVITDDILGGAVNDFAAMSMAVIVARDTMVARTAILPLGVAAARADTNGRRRDKYERLFALIEESAFDSGARDAAQSLIHARFRDTQINELAHELGGTIQPARLRYRAFLDIVRMLTEGRISHASFIDEFHDFTRAVAGKLDFGIYSLCVDRMFTSPRIDIIVKAALLDEILAFPPLVRKELVTNLLSSPNAVPELVRQARGALADYMTRDEIREVMLFTTLKLAWQAQRTGRRHDDDAVEELTRRHGDGDEAYLDQARAVVARTRLGSDPI